MHNDIGIKKTNIVTETKVDIDESKADIDKINEASLKLKRLLGLARKAGALEFGRNLIDRQLKRNKFSLLFLGNDAGNNTKKHFKYMAQMEAFKIVDCFSTQQLAEACGKENVAMVLVSNPHFATSMQELAGIIEHGVDSLT